MKRIPIAALLILVVLELIILVPMYAWSRSVQAMSVKLNFKDIPEHGLELVGPSDPSFGGILSRYLKGKSSAEIQAMMPFLVFVRNKTDQYVVAYSIKWEMVRIDGSVASHFTSYSQPGVLIGHPAEVPATRGTRLAIAPHSVRLFSSSTAIDPQTMEGSRIGSLTSEGEAIKAGSDLKGAMIRQIRQQLQQSTSITVSLDGVFFEDGSFVGPNSSGYFERMKAQIDPQLNLLAGLQASVGRESELEEKFRSLEVISNENSIEVDHNSSLEDIQKFHVQELARQITSLRVTYGANATKDYLLKLNKKPKAKLRRL